MCGSMVDI